MGTKCHNVVTAKQVREPQPEHKEMVLIMCPWQSSGEYPGLSGTNSEEVNELDSRSATYAQPVMILPMKKGSPIWLTPCNHLVELGGLEPPAS
jgi:hypothetical protein